MDRLLDTSAKTYKIVVLGDGGTGKTTLLGSKCNHKFNEASQITIGVDFACIETENDKNSAVLLAFDLGGQERFHFIHDSYIKGIRAAIILYDLTRFQSFDNIPKWHGLLQQENINIPIIIVGTKKDLVKPETMAQFQHYWEDCRKELPNSQCIKDHLFVSAKTFEGVEELFQKLLHYTEEFLESTH